MQFLKSLFCLQGLDNRTRFFSLCCAIYLSFIVLISAFTGNVLISLTILFVFTAVLAFTCLRRLQDAKLKKYWVFIPNILFILAALIIIFTNDSGRFYLLTIPSIGLFILLTYPSVRRKNLAPLHYILGYYGPVDMSEYQRTMHRDKPQQCRIEPTLAGGNSDNSSANISLGALNREKKFLKQNQEVTSPFVQDEQQTDIGEAIRLKLENSRKTQLIMLILMTIVFISFLASGLINYFSNPAPLEETQTKNTIIDVMKSVPERKHQLAMPDNFSLFLSQHQGIIINWQADDVNTPLLWSQTSAKGEDSCQQISFNNGKTIRTLKVQVENNTTANGDIYNNYFASFSPLDSEALIQSLAFRGSFSLCGYDFSLKGSQAAIGKKAEYANWLNY